MIIDFVGAPGVGKSTSARELAARLQACGRPVQLISSYRPAESVGPDTKVGRIATVLRRLGRPASELIATSSNPLARSVPSSLVDQLMALLPPRSMMWSFRLRQYLLRLAHAWRLAAEAEQITLFDQCYLQALCSLVVLGGPVDRERIAHAVALLPRPDVLIHLTAARTVLKQRLDERRVRQGRLERLLELDMRTNLDFVPAIEAIVELLNLQGQRILQLDCTDRTTLQNGVTTITREVIRLSSNLTPRAATAPPYRRGGGAFCP